MKIIPIATIITALPAAMASAKVCVPDPAGATRLEYGEVWQVIVNKPEVGDFLVSGMAMCSPSSSSAGSNPSISEGGYCWCKMTSPKTGAWVYNGQYDELKNCLNYCGGRCARRNFTSGF
ncbi:MAG: hypothetical protein LBL21_04105 [Rickettsiales bacterium]|nr:hypothetical protein [Rickettsiales bacterium]